MLAVLYGYVGWVREWDGTVPRQLASLLRSRQRAPARLELPAGTVQVHIA